MTSANPTNILYSDLILAVYPTSRGFSWILFEGPHKPVAWHNVHARPGRERHLLLRFRRILDRYEPSVLVLQSFDEAGSRRGPRIRRFCEAMMREASARGMDTPVFSREAIRMAFAEYGAASRSAIARVIASRIDDISHRLPEWKFGYSEDGRHSLFNAAALAFTYFVSRG